MTKRWIGLLALTFAVAGGAVAAAPAFADEPATALGKWMKPNMGAPMSADVKDFAKLKDSFNFVAGKVPSGSYGDWASIAQQGAAAAGKSDLIAVKAACKACHDSYKRQYKTEHKSDAFP